MAVFNVVNKDKEPPKYKSFSCEITKQCNQVKKLTDTLYFIGNGLKPSNGDIIYSKLSIGNVFVPLSNNSACIEIDLINWTFKYIKTNDSGKCTIINC